MEDGGADDIAQAEVGLARGAEISEKSMSFGERGENRDCSFLSDVSFSSSHDGEGRDEEAAELKHCDRCLLLPWPAITCALLLIVVVIVSALAMIPQLPVQGVIMNLLQIVQVRGWRRAVGSMRWERYRAGGWE